METSDEKIIAFHASLSALCEAAPQCTVTVRFPKWNPTRLTVNLLWLGNENERCQGGAAFRNLKRNHISLDSLDPHHPSIELIGINGITSNNRGSSIHSTEVMVTAVQVGIVDKNLDFTNKYQVIVRLQPSGILCMPTIHTQSFTGEVQVNNIETGRVLVKALDSKFEARETYEYDKSRTNGDRITSQIQRASILGEITIEAGSSLWDKNETLKNELDKICSVLSLCYRQTVNYYEVEYIQLNNRENFISPSIYRRKWPTTKEKISRDELINTQALEDNGLQKLIEAIESSNRAKDIHRAIEFLASSYEASAETAYFMAFSAMETIVSCCIEKTDENIISSSKWKKVESAIRTTLDEQLDCSIKELIIGKLPELKRSTLEARIKKALQKYHPDVHDLWPKMGFEDGMKRASSIRNGLFHAAGENIDHTLIADLIRIRTFTERILLKYLEWPDDQIWVWADQELGRINMGER